MALEPGSDKVFAEEPLASPTVQTGTATDAQTVNGCHIDIARGLALLGVGVVNVLAFASGMVVGARALDLPVTAVDVVAEYAVAMLFYPPLLSVAGSLFGVGLARQWQRLAEPRKVRRLRPMAGRCC